MYIRSRVALTGVCTLAAFALAGPAPASAAPYTSNPSLALSTTNPAIESALTVYLYDFLPNELVSVDLHSVVVNLDTVQTDAGGDATTVVNLPPGYRCEHVIIGTGQTSGKTAQSSLVIGPPSACGNGGGNGNTGHGNTGSGNTGHGNTGDNNTGHGNTGSGNSGHGNTGGDGSGWGNVSYARAMPGTESHAPEVALASIAGLALLGGAGFLRRRRSTH